jgi:hypothetical protein
MRVMLYEAAQSMLRSKKWSWPKAWAMQIARRRVVALARRLAVIMHRIWALEVSHEAIEVLDFERDRAVVGVDGLFLGEVGEGQSGAAGQIVFHPPIVAPVAGQPDLRPSVSS